MIQFNKRNIKIFTISLLFFFPLLWGCNKTLESGPLEDISLNLVFDNKDSLGVNAQAFLYNIYGYLPTGYNRVNGDVLDAGDDDAIPSAINQPVEDFSLGKINPYTLPDNVWDDSYTAIRNVNIFLSNIDVVPLNLPGEKDQWKAEARVLRAIAYFELIKRWGGVPIIGDTVYNANEKIAITRSSFDQCVDYISAQIDSAKNYLPLSYNATYFGRITRGAALAIESRVLLYAASPLNNPTNDLSKWKAAADAADSVMNLGIYSLDNSFYDVFTSRKNSEVILAHYNSPNSSVERNNGPIGSPRGDKGLTSPTQELVDAFEMSNGDSINDPSSGYNPQNPYVNRDPRLAYTVFYNGQSWLGRTVQTYDGGIDRPAGYGNATSGETRTGYYMRKFLSTAGSLSSYSNTEHDFPIIRYAEILLNYAEAENEAVGPDASVYNAINAIRKRAGLNPYALPMGLSQIQMRSRIHHERRVEMAFEEQRFWDIRRWKIAGTVLNGTLHGMQITKNSDNTFTYKVVNADNVTFDATKMYIYPIPYKETISNTSLTQNPNW
ncbi:RagB/SusD family nutrient uptake outer membrane protein [Arachidicoccus soli]|uniref:RagB/SusD family nutrient uptake outer membrane protein n=1 Tax=Arachidicoccus soli TaxID=2341117 RepID=A0A386HS83_9BACT|nr:RagB/SusD family nutrient uptake outer membrane protein [Arachidicoccus soli]AYD48436.1 RagB/SusD family nutrient uptake outer membrane protein [Arachidicoccus soli]